MPPPWSAAPPGESSPPSESSPPGESYEPAVDRAVKAAQKTMRRGRDWWRGRS
ncbi:MAG TPA: hypothetical protein VGF21_17290 [Thermoleophilaceae bacterium]|jgi:hypothetical protein